VRLAAYSLLTMTLPSDAPAGWDRCACALDEDADALGRWYVALGDALAGGRSPRPPHRLDLNSSRRVSRCLREAVADGDSRRIRAAVCLALAREQLGNVQQLEAQLVEAAAELAHQSSGAPAVAA
jgi:hypothetical protein